MLPTKNLRRRLGWRSNLAPVLLFPALLWAAGPAAAPPAPRRLHLWSPALRPGKPIPRRFTCSGQDTSPPLRWAGVPAGTQALALHVFDRDAGGFTHWLIWNLPPESRGLPPGVATTARAAGGVQGQNSWRTLGYGGPCPPPGLPHHYVFALYALKLQLTLPPGATRDEFRAAIVGHIASQARLVALFGR
ncbi:MAG: YbhB/YbcL family Raf kinase inhibitor-like protein [Terriglobales bacterium]